MYTMHSCKCINHYKCHRFKTCYSSWEPSKNLLKAAKGATKQYIGMHKSDFFYNTSMVYVAYFHGSKWKPTIACVQYIAIVEECKCTADEANTIIMVLASYSPACWVSWFLDSGWQGSVCFGIISMHDVIVRCRISECRSKFFIAQFLKF